MALDNDFYKTTPLLEMNEEQWESLCDGCGQCCYRKFIDGYGKDTTLFYTKIACNYLNLETGLCSDYCNRFKVNKECTHLTKKNVADFKWLPETCAYRLLYEGKELPAWHPLICGKPVDKNSEAAPYLIKGGIHEKDAEDWEDYILNEEKIGDK